MQATDKQAFAGLLVTIGELYSKQISPILSKLYWRMLERFEWKDIVDALQAHVQDPDCGQFMPKPADIIRAINGNGQTQSLQAWTKLEQAIRLVGPYDSVVFDDAIIHQVISEMGGWIKLCSVNEKELAFVAKEFQVRYGSYKHKPPLTYPRYFPGINEHQNARQGFACCAPRLLGDLTKAIAVFENTTPKEVLNQLNNASSQLLEGESHARTATIA